MRKYTDLDLWIEQHPQGEGYWVRASVAGKSEWLTFQEPPLSPAELEVLWGSASSGRGRELRAKLPEKAPARKLGRRLFETIFAGPVRDLFNEHLPGWMSRRGLRLRLHPGTPEIAGWPWELLHSLKEPLALSVRTPIVRHPVQASPLPALRTTYPLRVLVVISDPRGGERLQGEQELAEMRKALGALVKMGVVRLERLEPPTLKVLFDRLVAGPPVHVVHFIGHGTFEGGRGALLFEDDRGNRAPVPGETLAVLLADVPSLRLVVLNACHGASDTGEDRFSGVAQSLLLQRIPAVVAMQGAIRDDLAVAFSRRFYAALVRGRAVDWAVTLARKAILAAGGDPDWALPVLFLSAPDGRLFRWRPSSGFFTALALTVLMSLGYGIWHWRWTAGPPPPGPPESVLCTAPKALPDTKLVLVPGKAAAEPFCLGAFEVTRKEWKAVMGTDGQGQPDLPMSSVSWNDAQSFLGKLNALNAEEGGEVFRLPREDEWERAAQAAGAGSNCKATSEAADAPAPVGSFGANALGLYDMIGNVWEWVLPVGADPGTLPSGGKGIRRGGAFDSGANSCQLSGRQPLTLDRRHQNTGFRIASAVRGLAE